MFKPIDYLLDRVTMYRLLIYYLVGLLLAAMGLSLAGWLHYNAWAIAFSAGWLTLIAWLTHAIFARFFEAPSNVESTIITALILALIITPFKDSHDILFLTAAAGLAISSKYILAIRKKHIFNPAAVAVALTALGPMQSASWWVGSSQMLPYVIVGGLLLTRKIQRGRLVFTFLVAALASQTLVALFGHHELGPTLQKTIFHSSLWFLAFVMLPEPSTAPTSVGNQAWYGALVGALFPPQLHIFKVFSTPERALLVGNVFAYVVNPKAKLILLLKKKEAVATNTMDFVFGLKRPLKFKPGQYMEFTLEHGGADSRGRRRYFTLASSPTENNLRVGVKFYQRGSSFKKAMLRLGDHTMVAAAQLGGDFTLPDDTSQKLAFIAGGIGVTPFRSMLKYLIDQNEQRDVALIYSEKNASSLAYTDVFAKARDRLGAKIIYTLTEQTSVPKDWGGATGFVSAEMIARDIPDYHERLFYVSGPQPMVRDTRKMLHQLGVQHHQIKTDFFPGYV